MKKENDVKKAIGLILFGPIVVWYMLILSLRTARAVRRYFKVKRRQKEAVKHHNEGMGVNGDEGSNEDNLKDIIKKVNPYLEMMGVSARIASARHMLHMPKGEAPDNSIAEMLAAFAKVREIMTHLTNVALKYGMSEIHSPVYKSDLDGYHKARQAAEDCFNAAVTHLENIDAINTRNEIVTLKKKFDKDVTEWEERFLISPDNTEKNAEEPKISVGTLEGMNTAAEARAVNINKAVKGANGSMWRNDMVREINESVAIIDANHEECKKLQESIDKGLADVNAALDKLL